MEEFERSIENTFNLLTGNATKGKLQAVDFSNSFNEILEKFIEYDKELKKIVKDEKR